MEYLLYAIYYRPYYTPPLYKSENLYLSRNNASNNEAFHKGSAFFWLFLAIQEVGALMISQGHGPTTVLTYCM